MKKITLFKIATGLLGCLLLFIAIPRAMAIGIQPIRAELNVEPGQSVTGSVVIVNDTDVDFMAEPVIQVFYRNDEAGTPIYPTEDDLTVEDVRSWIEIPETPVEVGANSSSTVEYTVSVPSDAQAGGKYVSIAYQPLPKKGETGVRVNVRAASLLLINVAGEIVRKGEVTRFALPEQPKTDEPFHFEVTFNNTGNTHLRPQGWIELSQASGAKLKGIAQYADPKTGAQVLDDEIPVNLYEGNILPGSLRTFMPEWTHNLKEGSFKATLNLEYVDGTPITQTLDFEVKEDMSVETFDLEAQEGSARFILTVKNQGSAYERLKGAIEIKNNFGYKVAEVMIPEDIEYVAPGETKQFEFNWLETEIPKGRYSANLKASYGFSEKFLDTKISFGDVDRSKAYLIGGLVIAVLVALIALFSKRRAKN